MGLALTLALTAPRAHAAWPRDPGANLPISVSAGHDVTPAIAADGSDGVLIAWNDNRYGSDDTFVQRVNSKGAPMWSANGVALCNAAGSQNTAVVASDGAGGAIVAWQDQRNGANNDIYAQRVNAAGVVMWATNGVAVAAAANWQTAPRIIADGSGGAIITWFDNRTGDDDVYVQRLNASGAPQWTPNGVLLCNVAGSQNYPKLVSDGAGGAIVIWRDWRRYQDSDVFAQRVSATGVPQWTANGVDMTMGANLWRYEPDLISDGAGGAIAAWMDDRNSGRDIYVQRVNSSGTLQWGSGVRLGGTTSSGWSAQPRITSDGAGGAIVAWRELPASDYEIYAGRVNAAGVRQWATNGVPVCVVAASDQENPDLVADGLGGAIISWQDARNGTSQRDIYAQRLNGAGAAQWTGNGIPLTNAANDQISPAIAADSRGAAMVAWQDFRTLVTYDIYAQRIERSARYGNPEPEIAWVRDVPGEQGGHVRINWNRSYVDTLPTYEIGTYGIWRRVSASFATNAVARGGTWSGDVEAAIARPGTFRAEIFASQVIYWEGVGSIPARGEPWYTFVADTFQDSTSAGNPYTSFMVDAHGAFAPFFWSSLADSGYSVDNLPPGTPAPFSGQYSGGAMHLDWDPNPENDLSGYRLYRGATSGFTPGPGNLIATLTSTSYTDMVPQGSYYKLSAVDVHGNEGGFALAGPGTTAVADGSVPRELGLAVPRPNPTRSATMLTFTVPRDTRVSLAIHDARGRLVRTIVDGPQSQG